MTINTLTAENEEKSVVFYSPTRDTSVKNPSHSPFARTSWHESKCASRVCTSFLRSATHLGVAGKSFLGCGLATIQKVCLESWLNKYDLELSHVLSSYVVQGNFLAPSSSGYLVVSSLIRDLNFPLFVISDVLNFENRSLVLQGAWEDCGWMLAFVHWKWKG